MKPGSDRWLEVRGNRLHIREWEGDGVPFVLLHGLSSNAMTWEAVAQRLNAAGHRVVTLDQRGHGLSDKPETGYGFDQVTADLQEGIDTLKFYERPVVAGQSWGAGVVLQFVARYPETARGIVLVDGGFMSMRSRGAQMPWEEFWERLKPPVLAGRKRVEMQRRMREFHPDWSDEGIEHTLANFETLPDGTDSSLALAGAPQGDPPRNVVAGSGGDLQPRHEPSTGHRRRNRRRRTSRAEASGAGSV